MKTQILLLSLTTALLLGCSSTGSKNTASANGGDNNEPQSWFCEGALDNDSEDWACLKLTNQEIAQRTAESERPKTKEAKAEQKAKAEVPLAATSDLPLVRSTTGYQTNKSIRPVAEEIPAIDASTPLYISLAYQPAVSTSLLELPEAFWAIQIMALQDEDALIRFVADKQLVGVSRAKIASKGRQFYTLILGVYESKSIAEEAWASRPQSISYLQPYYRSLVSLQRAIRNGENL
jgi:septal ring-binding cell division protein DamX